MGFIPAAGLALEGIGAIKGLAQGQKKYNPSRAIAELRAAQPQGYLTPEDLRAAALTRGRIAAQVVGQGQLATAQAQGRSRARGLAGSPSEERDIARINQQTALGQEGAGNTAEEQLYNTRMSREEFGRQKALDIFGAEVGQSHLDQQRQQAENAGFWNSMTQSVIPGLINMVPGGGSAPGGDAITAPPATGFSPSGSSGTSAYQPSGGTAGRVGSTPGVSPPSQVY